MIKKAYEKYVLPKLLDACCSTKPVNYQRAKVVPNASGNILEIGIGSGLNLPYYSKSKITKLYGLDPSEELCEMANKNASKHSMDVEILISGAEEIELSSKDENRPLQIKSSDIEISHDEKKIKKYIPLSKRQDKPDSALWLIKQHNFLKDSQIAKLVGITKNSVTSIRNKSYWNYNNLNPKDPVALNLFTQKDLIEAIEKAERRIKREKKLKEKQAKDNQPVV